MKKLNFICLLLASPLFGADIRISQLPRTNSFGPTALLIGVAQGGGADTNTKAITVSGLFSNATLNGTATITNIQPLALSVNTNAPMTRSNVVQMLRGGDGLSGVTNAGTVSTNQTTLLSVQNGYQRGFFRTPPQGMYSWSCYAGNIITEADYMLAMTNMINDNLVGHGWNIIMITDGWQSTNAPNSSDGRISSTLTNDPTRFPNGIAWLIANFHSNGIMAGIYTEPNVKTSAGFPGTPYQYFDLDATNFTAWGVDYIQFHTAATGPPVTEYQNARFSAALAQASPFRPIALEVNLGTGGRSAFSAASVAGVTVFRAIGDLVTGDTNLAWADFVTTFDIIQSLRSHLQPGQYTSPERMDLQGSASREYGRVSSGMYAMLNCASLISCMLGQGLNPEGHVSMTNRYYLDILRDPLQIPASQLSSNVNGEVWAKKLVDGRIALGIFNRQTNSASTNVVYWSQLGLDTNVTCKVIDIWHNTNMFWTSGKLATNLPAFNADIGGAGRIYMLTPEEYPSVRDGTNLLVSVTRQAFTFSPTLMVSTNAGLVMSNAYIGPGPAADGIQTRAIFCHAAAKDSIQYPALMQHPAAATTYLNTGPGGNILFQAGGTTMSYLNGSGDFILTTGAAGDGSKLFVGGNASVTGTNFSNRSSATNGFASFATNIVASANAAGYTNSPTAQGVGINMVVNIKGTSGTYVFYNRSGVGGATVCGTSLFTNTLTGVTMANIVPVPVNCGIQVVSGVGVEINVYAQ